MLQGGFAPLCDGLISIGTGSHIPLLFIVSLLKIQAIILISKSPFLHYSTTMPSFRSKAYKAEVVGAQCISVQ